MRQMNYCIDQIGCHGYLPRAEEHFKGKAVHPLDPRTHYALPLLDKTHAEGLCMAATESEPVFLFEGPSLAESTVTCRVRFERGRRGTRRLTTHLPLRATSLATSSRTHQIRKARRRRASGPRQTTQQPCKTASSSASQTTCRGPRGSSWGCTPPPAIRAWAIGTADQSPRTGSRGNPPSVFFS